MPSYWIVKSEPSTYSFGDLVRDGRTRWDGVRNPQALIHLRGMRKGDRVLFYHTGGEKALVGLARVAGAPYPDPAGGDPLQTVIDIEADRALPRPVTLAEVKAEPALAALGLVRQGRLSVMPVTSEQWRQLADMSRQGSVPR